MIQHISSGGLTNHEQSGLVDIMRRSMQYTVYTATMWSINTPVVYCIYI